MQTLTKQTWNTRVMVKISILGVLAFVLMLFEMPLAWIAPPFIQMDISDLPALLGSFALGPMAGVIIQLLKNILKLIFVGSGTGGVGELANFIVGSSFAFTAGLIYFRNKTFKSAAIGLVAGTIVMTTVITLANYYIMFPFYAKLFGWPLQDFVNMGTAINENIVDLKTMMLYSIVPFNLLKGSVVTALTILIYKRVSPILHK